VGKEWKAAGGGFKFRVNTIGLSLTNVERGFYDEQARKIRTPNICPGPPWAFMRP
jgi:hypothetical protein